MSKIDLNQLNDIQYDVLKEIGNIGAGNATTALSKMLNQKMDMSVPKVELVPFNEISDIMGDEDQTVVGIMLGFEGDVYGMMTVSYTHLNKWKRRCWQVKYFY